MAEPENVIFEDGEIHVATAESRTSDLTRLLDVTSVEPPYILVGHSLGGIFTRLFAAKNPSAIAGLVFVDSSHPDQIARFGEAVRGADIPDQLKSEFLEKNESPNGPVMAAAGETGPFNHVPVAVFSQDPDRPILVSESPPPPVIQPVWRRVWSELQCDIANLSVDSSRIVVEGADHMVHLHAPELVAEAIMRMIERSRAN